MDIFKILKESNFLNKFYEEIQTYAAEMYNMFSKNITKNNENLNKNFKEDEIIGIIILNKIYFEHVLSYFYLIECRLYVPAFNEQRAAFEYLRLCRLYLMDENFREAYLKNKNIDFRNVRDNAFTQGKVIKRLDELESKLRSQKRIPLSDILHNHTFTKGSAFSQMHSELSKWAHGLNSNLIFPLFIDNQHKINLSIYNEENEISELYIKKYLEMICLNLIDHYYLLSSLIDLGHEFLEKTENILNLYSQYIKMFY